MAIINLTPDSFSDGGRHTDVRSTLARCEQLLKDGADLLDLGGESTRPRATPVSTEEELARHAEFLKSISDPLWLRLEPPQGATLTAADAPALFEALARIRKKTKGPAIDHVLLDSSFNASITQLPRYGLFGGATNGLGILAAGIVLAFMVLPFVAAVMRDVFDIVPPILRESAYGLGCTTWEVVRKVVLPYTQKGVIGGVMLGLGRALGETMAVTFVIGNANRLPTSLFSPGTSIASTLANEFGEAADFHLSTLFALGFLLFVITLVVLSLAKVLIIRAEKAKGA